MSAVICFIIGMMVGGSIGVATMCLVQCFNVKNNEKENDKK